MTIEGAGGAIKRLLPPEILLSILSWLDPPGLKAAVLVCKWWRSLGEQPLLWSWVNLTVWQGDLATVEHILKRPRFSLVSRIRLRAVSDSLLNSLSSHTSLREVSVLGTSLSTITPSLLARAVSCLNKPPAAC